jgi:DNA-directed RNA polymerase specialized sigma24 family protein
LAGWVVTVAQHEAIRVKKARASEPAGGSLELALAGDGSDPLRVLVREEFSARVRAAIRAMPPRHRELAEEFLRDPGLSHRARSRVLGKAWGTYAETWRAVSAELARQFSEEL